MMKNLVVILAFIVGMLFFGCGGSSVNDENTPVKTEFGTDTTKLEGTWSGYCEEIEGGVYSKLRINFAKNNFDTKNKVYKDFECSVVDITYEPIYTSGTLVVGKSIVTDSGKSANEVDLITLKENDKDVNRTVYDIYNISDGKLYFGSSNKINKDLERPTELDLRASLFYGSIPTEDLDSVDESPLLSQGQGALDSKSCYSNGVRFTKQSQIDGFNTHGLSRGCTKIIGPLRIDGAHIENLDGLSDLAHVGGLEISKTTLKSLAGLDKLTTIGSSLVISSNSELKNLTNLRNVKSNISNTNFIYHIKVLSNPSLRNLSGLANIDSIKGSLEVINNFGLTSLSGLDKIALIEKDMRIKDNNKLKNLSGLTNLTSVKKNIEIADNDSLTECNIKSICSSLKNAKSVIIRNNASGSKCYDVEKVKKACGINQLTIKYCPSNILVGVPFGETEKKVLWNPPSASTTCNAVSYRQTEGKASGSMFSIGKHPISYEIKDDCEQSAQCSFNVTVTSNSASSCLTRGITFISQQAIDNFATDYPDCTEIEGRVHIGYGGRFWRYKTNINNLNGLSQLTSIKGYLSITGNPNLKSFYGLHNLTSIGSSLLMYENSMTNLSGLDNITSIGGNLRIGLGRSNFILENLKGLENVTTIGGFVSINRNPDLTSLAGLDNLTSIRGKNLDINKNPITKNLTVTNNTYSSRGGSYRGPRFYRDFGVNNNKLLSECSIKSICAFIDKDDITKSIFRNTTGCNNIEEIRNACAIKNTPPIATPQTIETVAGYSKTITLTGNDQDGDSLTYHIVRNPKKGSLSGTAPNLTYKYPNNSLTKEIILNKDSFEFRVYDGKDYSSNVTVHINIRKESTSKPPKILGNVDTPGYAQEVTLSSDGTKAYIGDYNSGLQIIDITNPANPKILGSIDTPSYARGVTLSSDGTKAYIADGYSGLQIIDITNPANPKILGSVDTPYYAQEVTLSSDGTKAYVGDHSGLQIIDITNPANPKILGSIDTPDRAIGVTLSSDGTKAYVADENSGLQIIAVTNPANPKILGSVDTPGYAIGVTLSSDGTKAYVSDGGSGLQIIDITDSTNPKILGSIDTPGYARGITLSSDDTKAYMGDGDSGLQIIDITDSTNPKISGSVDTPNLAGGIILSSDGTKAYIADYRNGLQIIDITDSTNPKISPPGLIMPPNSKI